MDQYIPFLFLLGRIFYGGYFVKASLMHFMANDKLSAYAASKGVPMPKAAVYFSGLMIFLAGIYIVFGFLVKWGVLFLVIFLLVVSYKMHAFWRDTDAQMKMSNQTNFYKNMALLGAALIILFTLQTTWPYALTPNM